MEDLGIKLNPITKLRLFREAKFVIFSNIDNWVIKPERAEEILLYIKKYIYKIEKPDLAKKFYIHLWEKFKELKIVSKKFEMEEKEKIEDLVSLFLEEVMEKWNIDLASELMAQMKELWDDEVFIWKLKKNYPIEFSNVLKKYLKKK